MVYLPTFNIITVYRNIRAVISLFFHKNKPIDLRTTIGLLGDAKYDYTITSIGIIIG